jgi:hypothetical protein
MDLVRGKGNFLTQVNSGGFMVYTNCYKAHLNSFWTLGVAVGCGHSTELATLKTEYA